jgi:hypothetical protein
MGNNQVRPPQIIEKQISKGNPKKKSAKISKPCDIYQTADNPE